MHSSFFFSFVSLFQTHPAQPPPFQHLRSPAAVSISRHHLKHTTPAASFITNSPPQSPASSPFITTSQQPHLLCFSTPQQYSRASRPTTISLPHYLPSPLPKLPSVYVNPPSPKSPSSSFSIALHSHPKHLSHFFATQPPFCAPQHHPPQSTNRNRPIRLPQASTSSLHQQPFELCPFSRKPAINTTILPPAITTGHKPPLLLPPSNIFLSPFKHTHTASLPSTAPPSPALPSFIHLLPPQHTLHHLLLSLDLTNHRRFYHRPFLSSRCNSGRPSHPVIHSASAPPISASAQPP